MNKEILETFVKYSAIFLFGIIDDMLIALYTRSVAEKHSFKASGFSFLVTMVALLIYNYIITDQSFFWDTFWFAVGGMVGTYFIVEKS